MEHDKVLVEGHYYKQQKLLGIVHDLQILHLGEITKGNDNFYIDTF